MKNKQKSKIPKVLLNEIRQHMKRKSISYAELAELIGLSESGVKKIFISEDCSLSRVESICRAIGLQLSDLLKSVEDKTFRPVSFSKEQETFFKNNPKAWAIYWMISYEREEIDIAVSRAKISHKEFENILFKLDKLDLITLLPNGRIRRPDIIGIEWVSRSEFIMGLYKHWGSDLLEDCLSSLKRTEPEQSYFLMRYLKMTNETYNELVSDMKQLEKKYVNKAISEMRLRDRELVNLRWLTVMDQKSWIK